MPLIVFICTGNSCRSPMAEGLAGREFRSQPGWRFASAGIAAAEGLPATPEAAAAAAELGADIRAHRSRMVDPDLIGRAQLMVGMTRDHAAWLREQYPDAAGRIVTLGQLADPQSGRDVQDPIGGRPEAYRATARLIRDMLAKAAPEILRRVGGAD